jgi:acetyltransferase-like isoleucine patch superfamily enzyme
MFKTKIGKGTKIWYPESSNIYPEGVIIGKNCNIGTLVEIRKDVKIGNRVKIQAFTFIPEGVTIEDDVFVGPHVCFTNDIFPRVYGDWEVVPTLVKKGASIGAGCTICPGITIGENAMVSAGAVVTKDVPDDALVRGVPAQVVKYLRESE